MNKFDVYDRYDPRVDYQLRHDDHVRFQYEIKGYSTNKLLQLVYNQLQKRGIRYPEDYQPQQAGANEEIQIIWALYLALAQSVRANEKAYDVISSNFIEVEDEQAEKNILAVTQLLEKVIEK